MLGAVVPTAGGAPRGVAEAPNRICYGQDAARKSYGLQRSGSGQSYRSTPRDTICRMTSGLFIRGLCLLAEPPLASAATMPRGFSAPTWRAGFSRAIRSSPSTVTAWANWCGSASSAVGRRRRSSRSGSAASTAATPRPSRSATRLRSITSRARRSAFPSHASPPPRPRSARARRRRRSLRSAVCVPKIRFCNNGDHKGKYVI